MPDPNCPMEVVIRELHEIIGFDYKTVNMKRVRGVLAEFALAQLDKMVKM